MKEGYREVKRCPKCKGELNMKRTIRQIENDVSLDDLKKEWGCKCQEKN